MDDNNGAQMNYKYPFFSLVLGIIVLGMMPFGLSQQIEPSMEIDMTQGQTQSPFRIEDANNNPVFTVNPDGSIFPEQLVITETTFTNAYMDELNPAWVTSTPSTVITETAESGAGIYQFSYTLTADDISALEDSKGLFSVQEWVPYVTMQLENTGVGAISVNTKIFHNDFQVNADSDASVASGNYVLFSYLDQTSVWEFANNYSYDAGDVIGIKLWTSASGDLRLNKIAILGVPAELTVEAQNFSLANTNSWDGANDIAEPTFPFSPTIQVGNDGWTLRAGDPTNSANDLGFNNEVVSGIYGQKFYGSNFEGNSLEQGGDTMYWFEFINVYDTPNSLRIVDWR